MKINEKNNHIIVKAHSLAANSWFEYNTTTKIINNTILAFDTNKTIHSYRIDADNWSAILEDDWFYD